LQANGLRKYTGLCDLGRVGRQTDPKPAMEPPQTGALPRMRPFSRRRMGTGRVAAVGHGGVAVIAWLSDSTAARRGQARS